MNLDQIPTPETDAAEFPVMTFPSRDNPLVVRSIIVRDIERRLTVARGFLEDLEAAGVEGGVEDDDHHMTRIREALKLTAPKQ